MTLSGWCSAPAGARPQHNACRWDLCTCDCVHPHHTGPPTPTPTPTLEPTTEDQPA